MINIITTSLLFIIIAPFVGGLITGLDRIITARMQGRFGPPILQPFYDVLKLFEKDNLVVRRSQTIYILFYLLFMLFTGILFFTGGDLLLVIFSLTLAAIFFVLAGYKGSSPYSYIGASRELLQIMAYEPMVILSAVGMYMVTKTFYVADIITSSVPLFIYLPGVVLGFLYVLTIKLRKSPFDLSTSHHGHQELVKGITTEYSGPALAIIEIVHWYELCIILGFLYLFFAAIPLLGLFMVVFCYFLEIVIDNTFARLRWQHMLISSWLVTGTLGFINIVILGFFL